MKNQKIIRRLAASTICLAMAFSLFAFTASAAGPYYGTAPCPCGGTAHWIDAGVNWYSYSHRVNGMVCTYRRHIGYQGLVCPACGELLCEVPVDYETGHNHPVDVQPGQKMPEVMG